MRRSHLKALTGVLTFCVGAMLGGHNQRPRIIPSASSESMSWDDGKLAARDQHIYVPPQSAATELEYLLARSPDYTEFTPCYDRAGRRVGDHVVLPRRDRVSFTQLWRIAWTRQEEDHSELYVVEGNTLALARSVEAQLRPEWFRCANVHQRDDFPGLFK
jgi:hypothetical protein